MLCECALNCLKGNVPLTDGQKQKLCRHKQKLRSLPDKNNSLTEKRELLVQKGGFIFLLLKPLLMGLSTLAPLVLGK